MAVIEEGSPRFTEVDPLGEVVPDKAGVTAITRTAVPESTAKFAVTRVSDVMETVDNFFVESPNVAPPKAVQLTK